MPEPPEMPLEPSDLPEPAGSEVRGVADGPGVDSAPGSAAELSELRALLFREEVARIEALEARTVDAEGIAEVLPEAILRREASDGMVARSLESTIEAGLFRSARNDPQKLADAIHPVLGPAIRSMIQSSLRQSLERLNVALENALSPRGVRWRLEAARTGRPFSEVVLLKTLVFRVDHVLLVHRETGLVAAEAAAPDTPTRDADLVAGMLSAIRDFAADSFGTSRDDGLEEVELSGLTMILAEGPLAVLALVVRGNPPRSLRDQAKAALEGLHLEFGDALRGFDGDEMDLANAVPVLEELLASEVIEPKPNPLVRAIPIAAAVLALVWAGISGLREWREARDVGLVRTALEGIPGLRITELRTADGEIQLEGLRDPLGPDPWRLAREALGDEGRPVRSRFEPYVSLAPSMVMARARRALDPPTGSSMALHGGDLVITVPRLDKGWAERATEMGPVLPGVERVILHSLARD